MYKVKYFQKKRNEIKFPRNNTEENREDVGKKEEIRFINTYDEISNLEEIIYNWNLVPVPKNKASIYSKEYVLKEEGESLGVSRDLTSENGPNKKNLNA